MENPESNPTESQGNHEPKPVDSSAEIHHLPNHEKPTDVEETVHLEKHRIEKHQKPEPKPLPPTPPLPPQVEAKKPMTPQLAGLIGVLVGVIITVIIFQVHSFLFLHHVGPVMRTDSYHHNHSFNRNPANMLPPSGFSQMSNVEQQMFNQMPIPQPGYGFTVQSSPVSNSSNAQPNRMIIYQR